jgi:hypothetical protein
MPVYDVNSTDRYEQVTDCRTTPSPRTTMVAITTYFRLSGLRGRLHATGSCWIPLALIPV